MDELSAFFEIQGVDFKLQYDALTVYQLTDARFSSMSKRNFKILFWLINGRGNAGGGANTFKKLTCVTTPMALKEMFTNPAKVPSSSNGWM